MIKWWHQMMKRGTNIVTNQPFFQKYTTANKQLYQQNIDLRNAVLRGPLGKLITPEETVIEQNNQFYGITLADVLVASFSTYQKDTATVRLVSFSVDMSYQHQGLGSRLFRWALDDFKKQGYQQVSLSARASAHEFYLKQGFKDVGDPTTNQYLGVVAFDMQYMI